MTRTGWFPRCLKPVRPGFYDCAVRVAGGFCTIWRLEWDGVGFLVPFPMVVRKWRGLTRRSHSAQSRQVNRKKKAGA